MTDVLENQKEAEYLSMESQKDKIVQIMESEFGLPEKLLKMRALSFDQVEEIRCASTRRGKNKLLLDFVRQNGKHQDLIKALSESFQTHLVNYINSNGVYRSEFGLDWPLTERERGILDDNEEQLTEILDSCELLPKLYAKQVINVKQRNFISSITSDQARNEALLGMIRRLSKASYLTLIQCLKESHQAHIAHILVNGGAILPVHATLETLNLDETETQIANEFTNLLRQRNVSAEQANRVLNAVQLNIIAVKRGQSIVIYICCSTESEFNGLCKMIDNSEMKTFLQQLFDLLTHNINFKVLSVKIYESDVNKAKQMLQRIKELKNTATEGDSNFTSKDLTLSSNFGRWFRNAFSFRRNTETKHKTDNVEYADNDASISEEPQSHKVKDAIGRHFDFLLDRMFPDFVRNEKLQEDFCITSTQINSIEKKVGVREKSVLLIKYLIENKREEKLFDALDQSYQKHLVNFLENDGKYIETFGGDWPITNKEILIIQSNHEALVDLIEIGDLIGLLYQTGIINKQPQNFDLSQFTPPEKNEALLEILKRGSLNSYWQMIRCLRHSKQCHIADTLETGGVMVRVDFEVNHINQWRTKQISVHIVTLINNIYNGRLRVKDELMEKMFQLKLIGAKQREDVSLYFLCNQSEAVDRLAKMAKNGRLKEFAESFFNQLRKIQEEIKVTLKWKPRVFTRSRALIQAIHAEEKMSQWTPTNIDNLPLEVTDIIIQKSFAIFIHMKSQTDDEKFLDGFKQLSEVNECWFKRMTKRRLKNYYWSYLSGIYEKKSSISTFWKNNRQFREENVPQIRTGANRFKNQDMLSDIECALIARKSFTVKKTQASNKATDLSLISNYKNETNIHLLIEYLGLLERLCNAKAVRNGGTSVRVEINSRRPIKYERIIRFFEDSGAECLGSMKDRDFVLWIWCKSSDLNELQQSKYLRHPFCHLVEESPKCINEITINLDSDQLKKRSMVLPHIFDESFETIDEQYGAVAVTKLRNEFYCLNDDREIKIFCDRWPFALLRKFQLKEIKGAKDIVSCEKENVLYILDDHHYPHVCIWKIEQNLKTNQSEIKWLKLSDYFQPSTLSMSKRDQLLMVSKDPSPSLRIYGLDAQLRLLISLHQYIEWPIHAVESSTGNFVILHLLQENVESTITTLSRDGKTIVHNYQPENQQQRLYTRTYGYLSIDSNDGVFVADYYNHKVILLDSNLRYNKTLFLNNEGKDENRGKKIRLSPRRLYYDDGKKQLVVCGIDGVVIVFLKKLLITSVLHLICQLK